ncbi:MAG: hypothetical protein A4S09_04775 [Proteobacteria bacterium SG_bin7]|nr:MAG: hypothetical protein A4S09_04775 [Proteobacteria bacterium SG_bin7]
MPQLPTVVRATISVAMPRKQFNFDKYVGSQFKKRAKLLEQYREWASRRRLEGRNGGLPRR